MQLCFQRRILYFPRGSKDCVKNACCRISGLSATQACICNNPQVPSIYFPGPKSIQARKPARQSSFRSSAPHAYEHVYLAIPYIVCGIWPGRSQQSPKAPYRDTALLESIGWKL